MPDMSAAAPGKRRISRRGFTAIANRLQAPELIQTLTFAQMLTSQFLSRNLPLARPLESISLVLRFRAVIATANFSAVAVEAPQSILERLRITGTHRTFNAIVPVDLKGSTLFAWLRVFQGFGNTLIINGTRIADLGVPMGLAGATFGNTGTYDIEIHYRVPTSCMIGPHSRPSQSGFYWMPEDWTDSIQIQAFIGDATSFGTPGGGTTTTFTAFGSGAGSPTLDILANYAILGPLAGALNGAVVVRNEQTVVPSVAAIANNVQLLPNLQKNRTTNIVVKSGVNLTGVSATVEVFASLSDVLLNRTQIIADNKPVRNNSFNYALKEYAGRMHNTIVPQGYFPITFVESGSPLTLLQANATPGGGSFLLQSDILTANANNMVKVVQEMVYVKAA